MFPYCSRSSSIIWQSPSYRPMFIACLRLSWRWGEAYLAGSGRLARSLARKEPPCRPSDFRLSVFGVSPSEIVSMFRSHGSPLYGPKRNRFGTAGRQVGLINTMRLCGRKLAEAHITNALVCTRRCS
jgi:hypothetical protein